MRVTYLCYEVIVIVTLGDASQSLSPQKRTTGALTVVKLYGGGYFVPYSSILISGPQSIRWNLSPIKTGLRHIKLIDYCTDHSSIKSAIVIHRSSISSPFLPPTPPPPTIEPVRIVQIKLQIQDYNWPTIMAGVFIHPLTLSLRLYLIIPSPTCSFI